MTAGVTIRPRRDDDLAAILSAVHEQDGYPVKGVADPRAWLNLTAPLGTRVTEFDGKIAGHVALTEAGPADDATRLWREQNPDDPQPLTVIGRLFVSPDARGHRLGARLTTMASQAAHDSGQRPVLDVMLQDAAAIDTYEVLGWTPLGDLDHRHSGGRAEPARAYTYNARRNQG